MHKNRYISFYNLLCNKVAMFLLFAFTVSFSGLAQRVPQSRLRGEVYYAQEKYHDALEMFTKYERHKNAILDEMFLARKSDVFYKLAEFDSAAVCYARSLETDPENVNYKYLWELLSRSSFPHKYDEVAPQLTSFHTQVDEYWRDRPSRFEVEPFNAVNSSSSEYGAVDYKGRTYFSSNNNRTLTIKDNKTKVSYYDIYSVNTEKAQDIDGFNGKSYHDLSRKEKRQLKNEIESLSFRRDKSFNSRYNDGPISFYGEDAVFVTSNQRHRKSVESTFNLHLYEAKLNADGEAEDMEETYWGEVFSPNSFGHVTFSPDGNMACVVVKLKDGETGSDLYFSQKVNGKWDKPMHGGEIINTSKDEVFPYWASDGLLYYSSDGFKGSGGLDVYEVDPTIVGDMPRNLGNGINTNSDDFAFNINAKGAGYLSSNRKDGQGKDDIYKIELQKGTIKVVLVCDTIWATEPWFRLSDKGEQYSESFNIRENPVSIFTPLAYNDYSLIHGFPVDTLHSHIELYQDTVIVYVDFPEVDTLHVRFNNFCFDCDALSEINQKKFNILVKFLEDFPELNLVVEGNTDMFGTTKYNEDLGMRRALTMETFLKQAGVDNPIEKISNGKRKTVSRTDHHLNRRVDIKLFWPDSTRLLTYIESNDRRLENDLVINYDIPVTFDEPIEEGYYLHMYRSNRYMHKEAFAQKYGLKDGSEVLLFSNKWNEFNFYFKRAFENEAEARDFMQKRGLKARIVFLK